MKTSNSFLAFFAVVLCFFAVTLSAATLSAADEPMRFKGEPNLPGNGKHVVLVSGDEEYRSEECLVQLGKILAQRHGFDCTVLFAINPQTGKIDPVCATNIPHLDSLKTADVMIVNLRFRNLPDEQMQHIDDYLQSGKPVLGMRTATHAFSIPKDRKFARYSYNYSDSSGDWTQGFGRKILGETWINHHGHHAVEATRGIIAPEAKDNPIVQNCEDIFGPTDVYTVRLPLPGDSKPLVLGLVLEGMKPDGKPVAGAKNNPPLPIAWTKSYTMESGKSGKVFTTTMGSAEDLNSEGVRRLLVNAVYYLADMESKIPAKTNVGIVGEYQPSPMGWYTKVKGGVSIVLPGNAHSAIVSAAADLQKALQRVFPDDAFVIRPDGERCIKINVSGQGKSESFRIKNDGQSVTITAADTTGAVYGMYALLEQYGCGFYLTYDTFPEKRSGKFNPSPNGTDKEFSDAPLVKKRYSFNWHNFLSGCTGWDLPQWKSWIDQCRKLRYNVIMVHAYGNNPMFTFEYKGIKKPVGALPNTQLGTDWGTPHVNDVRRMVGGEHFDNNVFGTPPSFAAVEKQPQEVQAMMKEVFRYAKAQGMNIAFQIDADTNSSNPAAMMAALPEHARIKADDVFRPRPDTPEGKEYYANLIGSLLGLYPEINEIVICSRVTPAGAWKPLNFEPGFPDTWKTELNEIKEKHKDIKNDKQFAAYFWLGKAIKTFQEIVREKHPNVSISQASWMFKDWIPFADAGSPKDVPFLPLDYRMFYDKAEFSYPDGVQWIRKLTDSGRRITPILWSHHDDGKYIGRTFTPYNDFAKRLEEAGCDSYGIIHWVLRPHDLYFKAHSVQVWEATKNQPLEKTCGTMADNLFGNKNEQTGRAYLLDWIRNAPIYGRETSDFMIDTKFAPQQLEEIRKRYGKLTELFAQLNQGQLSPERAKHTAYWQGLEAFNVSFWENETALQQAVEAVKKNDIPAAQALMAKTNPAAAIKQYGDYASQLGFTCGDLGLLVLMNMKWYPSFVGMKQILGEEDYRINFSATYGDPLSQSQGMRSFHIDGSGKLWLVQGERELKGKAWKSTVQTPAENVDEIFQEGLTWTQPVNIPIVPAMYHKFADLKQNVQADKKRSLTIYVVNDSEAGEFDLVLYEGERSHKLSSMRLESGKPTILGYAVPADFKGKLTLGVIPKKGSVTLCGLVMKQE